MRKHKMPVVKSLMTPFPHSIDRGASLAQARVFMRKHAIHHLPVTDDQGLIGIITDRDIKLFLGPDFAYPDERQVTVGEVLVGDPYVVGLDAPLATVLEHMCEHHIGSALVVRRGKLAGIFTAVDACRNYARLLRELYPDGGDEVA